MTTSLSPRSVIANIGVDYGGLEEVFNALVLERGLAHSRCARFASRPVSFETLEHLGLDVLASIRHTDNALTAICGAGFEPALIYVTVGSRNMVGLTAHAADHVVVDELVTRITAGLRAPDTDPDHVRMHLWSMGPKKPGYVQRKIDAPEWRSVAGNYPEAARNGLAEAMTADAARIGGLALWHGPPGTGKTTAVRALARAWRSWCDVQVVVDPESLLANPSYLMEVITHATDDSDDDDDATTGTRRRSRLVVLEDAGELVCASARAETGQGLSRILNVTDGLIGRHPPARPLLEPAASGCVPGGGGSGVARPARRTPTRPRQRRRAHARRAVRNGARRADRSGASTRGLSRVRTHTVSWLYTPVSRLVCTAQE
jgi:hypothetical protein